MPIYKATAAGANGWVLATKVAPPAPEVAQPQVATAQPESSETPAVNRSACGSGEGAGAATGSAATARAAEDHVAGTARRGCRWIATAAGGVR